MLRYPMLLSIVVVGSTALANPELHEIGLNADYKLFELTFEDKPQWVHSLALSSESTATRKLSVFTGSHLFEYDEQFRKVRSVDFTKAFSPLRHELSNFDVLFDKDANLQYVIGWAQPAKAIHVVSGDGMTLSSFEPDLPAFSFWGKAKFATLVRVDDDTRVAVVNAGPVSVLLYSLQGDLIWKRQVATKGLVDAASGAPIGSYYFIGAGGKFHAVPLDGISPIITTSLPSRSSPIINQMEWDDANSWFVIKYAGLQYAATVSRADGFAKAVAVKQPFDPIPHVVTQGPDGPIKIWFSGGRQANLNVSSSTGVSQHQLDIGLDGPVSIPRQLRRQQCAVLKVDMPPLMKGDALLAIASKLYVVRPRPKHAASE
ncbi:MAG: hypothetical protein SFZ23_03665 [Planctomycetota bacterium]|nr:hypothetical protein [Planctomycetota bacterium]